MALDGLENGQIQGEFEILELFLGGNLSIYTLNLCLVINFIPAYSCSTYIH